MRKSNRKQCWSVIECLQLQLSELGNSLFFFLWKQDAYSQSDHVSLNPFPSKAIEPTAWFQCSLIESEEMEKVIKPLIFNANNWLERRDFESHSCEESCKRKPPSIREQGGTQNPSWINSPKTGTISLIFPKTSELWTIHKSIGIWGLLILVLICSLLSPMKAQVASLGFWNYINRRSIFFVVAGPRLGHNSKILPQTQKWFS